MSAKSGALVVAATAAVAIFACVDTSLRGTRCGGEFGECLEGLVCCAGRCEEQCTPTGPGGSDAGGGNTDDGGGGGPMCTQPAVPDIIGPQSGVPAGHVTKMTARWAPVDAGAGCSVVYEWQSAEGCLDGGTLDVRCSELASDAGFDFGATAELSQELTEVPDGGRKYWRVRACNQTNTSACSEWSAIRYFDFKHGFGDWNYTGTSLVSAGGRDQVSNKANLYDPTGGRISTGTGAFTDCLDFTRAIAWADVNGNGRTDIFVASGCSTEQVVSYELLYGTGFERVDTDNHAGCNVRAESAHDVNGDGFGDVLTSCPATERNDLALLFLGGRQGDTTLLGKVVLRTTSGTATPLASAPIGDVDGDGLEDLAVIATQGVVNRLMLFLGKDVPKRSVPAVSPSFEFSELAGASFGGAVSAAADLDQDGRAEFAVRAGNLLYVVSLSRSGELQVRYNVSVDCNHLVGVGDVIPNGIGDVVCTQGATLRLVALGPTSGQTDGDPFGCTTQEDIPPTRVTGNFYDHGRVSPKVVYGCPKDTPSGSIRYRYPDGGFEWPANVGGITEFGFSVPLTR